MFLKASGLIFENAKGLRAQPTHAETLMWGYLKQRPFNYKFRRQHPIAECIADFYCHELRLIIEIDGDIHAEPEVAVKDICFLRFTNNEVEKHMQIVISKIENYIVNHPKHMH